MEDVLRPSGIDVVGDLPWGTHFCHFYDTEQDLLDFQVPYFKAGLENNEHCIWVTSGHITVEKAITALRKAVPDLDHYITRGSIEIVSHVDWYMEHGKFKLDSSVQLILDRLRTALRQNFEGIRTTGDEAWINREDWDDFIAYEKALNPAITGKPLIMSCSFNLGKCEASDVLDVAAVHERIIAKRKGKWEILELPELKQTKAQLYQENELLEQNIEERTKELDTVSSVLEESQSHLRTIFDTTDIAFILLDSDLKILSFNTVANHWSELSFGTRLKEGAFFIELLHENRKKSVRNLMNTAMAGNTINYERSYPLLDGSLEWYSISINPVKDTRNQIIGLCCSATNITMSKKAEFELTRIAADLVQRNKNLEQFAYIVSHYMRAPLANIIGLTQMLKEGGLTLKEKTDLEKFLLQSITKLDEIVKDLNHILQAQQVISEKKEKVILSDLCNEVLTSFHSMIQQEQVRVSTDFSQVDELFTIKSYMYSIFYNLISNSIKFRQPGKTPVIEIRTQKEKEKIIIRFKDNGRGIDLEGEGKEVFGLYKRFHFDTEGKGIGLYMVKNLAETLGGTVSVNSHPNGGATFSIELPV